MVQSINLIPQYEVQEQQKTALVKASTVFSIVLLVLVAAVSTFFYFTTNNIKKEIATLEGEIEGFRSEISARAKEEVSARNLDQKYSVLKDLLSTRNFYSELLNEFRERQPEGIDIEAFSVRGEAIDVTGSSNSYISVATFVNNLLGEDLSKDDGLRELFVSVSLNSVTLESSKNKVKFSILVNYDPDIVSGL